MRGSNPRSLVADPDSRSFPGGYLGSYGEWSTESGISRHFPVPLFLFVVLKCVGKALENNSSHRQEKLNSNWSKMSVSKWWGTDCIFSESFFFFQFLHSLTQDWASLVLILWSPSSDLLPPSPVFSSPLSFSSSSCWGNFFDFSCFGGGRGKLYLKGEEEGRRERVMKGGRKRETHTYRSSLSLCYLEILLCWKDVLFPTE